MEQKFVEHNGLRLRIVTRVFFAHVANVSYRTINQWERRGIILPPIFEDQNKVYIRKIGGKVESFTYKYFLYDEVMAVQAIIRKFSTGKKWRINEESVGKIHAVMRDIRNRVRNGDPNLMTYPLILEFKDYQDFYSYFSEVGFSVEIAQNIFMKGNKIIKLEEINGGKEKFRTFRKQTKESSSND